MFSFFFAFVLISLLLGNNARRAARLTASQREADHQRYLQFCRQREVDRARIQDELAEQSRAFERERQADQQAREDRRRLSPSWELVRLLRQQGRISQEEYVAYCFDKTGEYCPTLLVD
jgi:hypothetical protein